MNVETLVQEIIAAKEAYYTTGTPIMSDLEFDNKIRQLRLLDPNNPALSLIGTDAIQGEKSKLKYKMVSTEKSLSIEEMSSFWRRIGTVGDEDEEIVESNKVDGLSLNLTYVSGLLVKAETSGNGEYGSIKTAKALMIPDIPKKLNSDFTGQVSGEAHLTDENFIKLNEILAEEGADLQKNSRNSVSGLINSDNLSRAEDKLALIEFKAWGVYEDIEGTDMFGSYDTYAEQLEKARSLGFNTVEYHIITKRTFDGVKALDWLSDFEYENDGLVYRINSNAKARMLGTATDYLNGATALKPEPEGALTTVIGIEWAVGSREITPTVIFEPVVLGGAVVQRAGGHSVKNLITTEAYVGNKVFITRQGGVIPKLNHRILAEKYS